MKRLLLLACLLACGEATAPTHDIADSSQLVGSYVLAVYAATPGSGITGTLNLKADSTYTLAVSADDAWKSATTGRWTWTREGNLYLPSVDVYGSIVRGGIGMGGTGYPSLFFRKR